MINKQEKIFYKMESLLWRSGDLLCQVLDGYEDKYGTYRIGWIGLGQVRDRVLRIWQQHVKI